MMAEHNRTQGVDESAVSTISDLSPAIELVEKPKMAKLYLKALNRVVTVPELLEEVDLTKSTVYEYVEALQNGGLMKDVGEKEGATAYNANEFTIIFKTGSAEIKVTPELVEVLSHQDENREIQAFVDQYGVATLAEFIDLAYEQAQGDVTTRMIANILDISPGSAYDMLEQVQRILDIGGDGEPETFDTDEISENEREELLKRSQRD